MDFQKWKWMPHRSGSSFTGTYWQLEPCRNFMLMRMKSNISAHTHTSSLNVSISWHIYTISCSLMMWQFVEVSKCFLDIRRLWLGSLAQQLGHMWPRRNCIQFKYYHAKNQTYSLEHNKVYIRQKIHFGHLWVSLFHRIFLMLQRKALFFGVNCFYNWSILLKWVNSIPTCKRQVSWHR